VFMTDEANYFYEVMPFSLKIIEVTYQRYIDKVLRDLTRRNIEVYFNDMVVKSESYQ